MKLSAFISMSWRKIQPSANAGICGAVEGLRNILRTRLLGSGSEKGKSTFAGKHEKHREGSVSIGWRFSFWLSMHLLFGKQYGWILL